MHGPLWRALDSCSAPLKGTRDLQVRLDPGCEHVTQLAPLVVPQSPVHDGGTTSSHHGPDPPFGVQQGQLQARPTFGIQVCNVSFLGIRQQQVGPVGIPFTKVPDIRTLPPSPFPEDT